MKIIIDCQPLVCDYVHPSAIEFIIKCHKLLLQKNPESEWLFVLDKNYVDNEMLKEIPLQNILFKKIISNQFGWKLWYDYQLPSLIKKVNADLLITTGGVASSSSIAQCVWVAGLHENNYSKKPNNYFRFYKKRLQKTIEQSKTIFTVSEKTKQFLIEKNKLNEKRISVLRNAVDENFKPLLWGEKESIKTKYAAGVEYFIVLVDEQHQALIHVLKAFSSFKKRQQSNMQLVLVGQKLKNDIDFIEKLETFKYRNDVHVYDNINEDELRKIISAAYAFVHPFHEDEIGIFVLNAFKANVPIVISEKGSLAEIAADAALYADANDIETLANQMMLLYKDEKLRSAQIEKGELQWQKFSWDETVQQLENAIMQAADKQ